MLLGLETFSYEMAFYFGTMNVFDFIQRTHELGLDGVQINLVGRNWNHLGGAEPGHLREVRRMIESLGMFVEVDMRGTDPERLTKSLRVCEALGADVLRTYASVGGDLAEELKQAPNHIRQVLPICADIGVRIAVENHEYETAKDILTIIEQVGSEYVGALVDTGNSMMVWEDPVAAVRMMAPFAVSTHFKDHAVIVQNGEPLVVGVTLGKGGIDGAEVFRILSTNSPLKRINIEVCYGYFAPFRRPQEQGAGAKLGGGAFRVLEPPFDPSWIFTQPYETTPKENQEQLLARNNRAVEESVRFVKELNRKFG
jgi:sugar phosphate isomerase/epimerase